MASNAIQVNFRKTPEAKERVQNMADEAIDFLNRNQPTPETEFARQIQELEEATKANLERIFRLSANRYAAYSKGREMVVDALERIYRT